MLLLFITWQASPSTTIIIYKEKIKKNWIKLERNDLGVWERWHHLQQTQHRRFHHQQSSNSEPLLEQGPRFEGWARIAALSRVREMRNQWAPSLWWQFCGRSSFPFQGEVCVVLWLGIVANWLMGFSEKKEWFWTVPLTLKTPWVLYVIWGWLF